MKQITTILILLFCVSAFAQPDGKMKERIRTQKIAHITNKLNLTPEEAQQFWPIYNAFDEATEKVRMEDLREIKREMRSNENMSDKDANALLNKLLAAEEKMYQAKLKLVNDLKNVIPPRKIILLKAAEDEFNRKLLERLKEFRGKRH